MRADRGLGLASRYVAAVAGAGRLPVPDLLAVRDLVQDARRDLRLPAGLVAGLAPARATTPSCSRTATPGPSCNSLVIAGVSTVARHAARHAVRLLDRALPHRRRQFRHVGPQQPHAAADRHRVPGVPALRQARLGRHLSRPDRPLHRLQPALRDLDDARLHPGHPARARGIGAGRRLHALGRVPEGRAADGAHAASSPPPCSPSSSPGTSSCSRWS